MVWVHWLFVRIVRIVDVALIAGHCTQIHRTHAIWVGLEILGLSLLFFNESQPLNPPRWWFGMDWGLTTFWVQLALSRVKSVIVGSHHQSVIYLLTCISLIIFWCKVFGRFLPFEFQPVSWLICSLKSILPDYRFTILDLTCKFIIHSFVCPISPLIWPMIKDIANAMPHDLLVILQKLFEFLFLVLFQLTLLLFQLSLFVHFLLLRKSVNYNWLVPSLNGVGRWLLL